ncbi:MAG: type II/IV secretion system protein [Acidimicrobiales bacterium]
MNDVDAIRWMASEHDLEFVDLDTYGVDPAAGEILPPSLARHLHVVAIKRKFGTPVIATADPDDLEAQDTVRASIGRDFISVVASSEQIDDYLDQLFGPEGSESPPASMGMESSALGAVDSVPSAEPVDVLSSGLFDDLSLSDLEELSEGTGPGPEAPSTQVIGNGKAGTTRSSRKKGKAAARAVEQPTEATEEDQTEPQITDGVEPDVPAGITQDRAVDAVPLSEQEDTSEAVDTLDETTVSLSEGSADQDDTRDQDGGSAELIDALAVEQIAELAESGGSVLEPATTLLPGFGSIPADAPPPPPGALVITSDELAELARTVEGEELEAPAVATVPADSTALAADLVAEAVATYQEQHGEEQPAGALPSDSSTDTAHFPPLAKALVEGGRVSLADMEAVFEEHERTDQSVARILTAQKLVTEADLMWGMAQEMGLEFVDLDVVGVNFAEAGSIPEATARYHNVIVIGNDEGTPVVAASNPTDVFAMDDLRTIMGRNFNVVVATRTQIGSYIGRAFNSGADAADMAMEASLGFDGSSQDSGVDDIQAVTEEAPIVRYVNLLILQALNERASDIHVEPTGSELRIRYRIDGVLHDVSTAPRAISAAVTTRLKVMADMNVAEHRIPQDGRISLNVGSKGIDLRIATLPTIHGEKVVMRVLDKSSVVLGFADLGFDEDLLKTYEGIYTKPYGTILVTGPTGSGKSTTLYTTLTALNSPEKNIITVEDPVELQLKGVNQVQLNVKAGLTFASALRSILRSDPDIVLVGEIRDKETAVIAIEAALTGHMVLATLHTNSAASTPMRLIEMGLEPFLVTSALSGVLAQRLARRLCVHCKDPYEPTKADITAAGWSPEEIEVVGGMTEVYRAVGCSACSNTGYRGRKALAELLPMTEEIERTVIEGGSVEEIHRIAVAQGMMTLRQSGLRKAIEGETTLEEVLRVVA